MNGLSGQGKIRLHNPIELRLLLLAREKGYTGGHVMKKRPHSPTCVKNARLIHVLGNRTHDMVSKQMLSKDVLKR
jgi:hypothetical protein